MFAKPGTTKQEARNKARKVVAKLSNLRETMSHERHIHFDECQQMGLNVARLEDDNTLQDLVLTVHHTYMHTFSFTPAIKIVENHRGVAMIHNMGPVPVLKQ